MTCAQAILSCQNQSHGPNDMETRRDGTDRVGEFDEIRHLLSGFAFAPTCFIIPLKAKVAALTTFIICCMEADMEILTHKYSHSLFLSSALLQLVKGFNTHQVLHSLSIGSKRFLLNFCHLPCIHRRVTCELLLEGFQRQLS